MRLYRLHKILLILGACAMLTACDGIMDSIYDEAPADTDFSEGITMTDSNGRMTLYLNACSYEQWHYICLDDLSVTSIDIPTALTGDWDGQSGWTYHLVEGTKYTQLSTMQTDAQPEPEKWDLAIHHFDARTNGGAVIMTESTSIDELSPNTGQYDSASWTRDVWNNTQVITDLTEMMAFRIGYQNIKVNSLLSTWATMDFSTPPPTYSSSGKVYILKLASGKLAALHLKSYMSPAGTKGYLTIDIKYPY